MIFNKYFCYLKRFGYSAWAMLAQALIPPLKPSAICIGAQKGGTTALFNYLSSHPDIVLPRVKEIDFFNCNSRFNRGYNSYHSFFPRNILSYRNKITLDITPGYIEEGDKTAKRIYEYNPDTKIIVLLRNPITRAFSAWQMYRKFYINDKHWFYKWMYRCDASLEKNFFLTRPPSFGESFENDIIDEINAMRNGQHIEMPILKLGLYYESLKPYFEYFPESQILISASEDMKKDLIGELKKMETFIGLKPHFSDIIKLKEGNINKGIYKEKISEKEHDLLRNFYQEPNKKLFHLLKKEFNWN